MISVSPGSWLLLLLLFPVSYISRMVQDAIVVKVVFSRLFESFVRYKKRGMKVLTAGDTIHAYYALEMAVAFLTASVISSLLGLARRTPFTHPVPAPQCPIRIKHFLVRRSGPSRLNLLPRSSHRYFWASGWFSACMFEVSNHGSGNSRTVFLCLVQSSCSWGVLRT